MFSHFCCDLVAFSSQIPTWQTSFILITRSPFVEFLHESHLESVRLRRYLFRPMDPLCIFLRVHILLVTPSDLPPAAAKQRNFCQGNVFRFPSPAVSSLRCRHLILSGPLRVRQMISSKIPPLRGSRAACHPPPLGG